MVRDGGRWKDDKVLMANCQDVCMFERFYVPNWLYEVYLFVFVCNVGEVRGLAVLLISN